jgi:hypothetical protein
MLLLSANMVSSLVVEATLLDLGWDVGCYLTLGQTRFFLCEASRTNSLKQATYLHRY